MFFSSLAIRHTSLFIISYFPHGSCSSFVRSILTFSPAKAKKLIPFYTHCIHYYEGVEMEKVRIFCQSPCIFFWFDFLSLPCYHLATLTWNWHFSFGLVLRHLFLGKTSHRRGWRFSAPTRIEIPFTFNYATHAYWFRTIQRNTKSVPTQGDLFR